MARSTRPLSVQDIANFLFGSTSALDSTAAGAFKITRLDSAGGAIEASSEQLSSSASRTATLVSADQTNRGHRGAYIFAKINSAASSGSFQLTVQAKLPGGGSSDYVTIVSGSSYVPSTGASVRTALVYPATITAVSGVNEVASISLPRIWRTRMVHGTTRAIDYSVLAVRLP
jgi:hypothetical protein